MLAGSNSFSLNMYITTLIQSYFESNLPEAVAKKYYKKKTNPKKFVKNLKKYPIQNLFCAKLEANSPNNFQLFYYKRNTLHFHVYFFQNKNSESLLWATLTVSCCYLKKNFSGSQYLSLTITPVTEKHYPTQDRMNIICRTLKECKIYLKSLKLILTTKTAMHNWFVEYFKYYLEIIQKTL